MQKRVVGNINELNEASRKTASEKSANTAGTDRDGCKANKTSFGRFKKFAVIIMLLIVSVFCAIGSADWIISQQEQLPGGSGSTFVYDKKTLQNYIALKGSDETEAAAKVAEAEEYASLQTETDSDDSAVADKFTVKKAAVSKKSAVSTYANELESAIYGKSAIYNGKPIVAIKKTAGIDNAAAELPSSVLNGSLLTSYKPLTDGSVTEADLTEAYFAEGATSGLPQNAGTYAILVKIKGLEAYGYAVKIFTILPCPVTVGWSGVDFANGFTYDGAAHPVTAAAKIASSYNGNIAGSAANANLSVSIAKDGVSVSEVKTAGSYTLAAASGNDNYVIYNTEATRTTSFKVKQAPLAVTVNGKTITYGNAVPGFTLSYKGFVGGETASVLGGTAIFTHRYEQFSDVGTYTVTASGLTSENYKITYNDGTLTVIKYGLKLSWSGLTFVYGKTAYVPTATITNPLPSGAADPGLNVSVTTGEAINVGSYTAKASVPDDGNYYIASGATANFTVTAKEATVTITLSKSTITYGDKAPDATITYDGVLDGDTLGAPVFDYGGYKKGSDVGTYTVTVKELANNNYDIKTTSASFTVTPYRLTIEWSDTPLTYNKTVQKPIATIKNPITGLTAPAVTVTTYSETGVAADSINAGSYTAKASVTDGNYSIASGETANFTIKKKSVTIIVGKSVTYGDTATFSESDLTITGLIGNDTLGGNPTFASEYTASSPVTEEGYAITVTFSETALNPNYSLDSLVITGTLTVNKKALTIKVKDCSVNYGGDPDFELEYNGFVNGETSAVLSGAPDFACDYEKGSSPAGKTYTVTVSGLYSKNYEITYLPGTLTVSKKSVTITIEDKTITYGDEAPTSYGYTIKDTLTDEDISTDEFTAINSEIDFACSYEKGYPAGDYKITATCNNDNYTLNVNTGTLKVNKAKLTLVANGNTITYGDAPSANGYYYTGFLLNDNEQSADITGTVKYSFDYNQYDNIYNENGSKIIYHITPSVENFSSTNYACTEISNGILTVNKLPVKANVEKTYNDSSKDTNGNYAGLHFNKDLFKDSFAPVNANITLPDEYKLKIYNDINDSSTAVAKNFTGTQDTSKAENGFFEYSFGDYIKAGSTYAINGLTLKNTSNYSLSGTVYLKYKTAKIGKTYYTIEDALAVSGDIILAGDSSSYVTTAFSNLKLSSSVDSAFSDYKSNYAYTLNEKTLTVPYDSNGTIPTSGDSGITEYGNVYAALIIHNNVKLTISSGNLVVSAEVGFNQSVSTTLVGKHGVIMNNGKIIVESGEIKAYGYIKGGDSGLIELKSGTTTLDALSIYDWPGGRAGLSMCSSVFPTNAYTLHNISCPTKIYSGAIYKARVFLNATTNLDETIIVIGIPGDTKSEGMFNADDSSGYVLKSVTTNIADKNTDKDINCNITLSNQRDNDSAKVNHRDNIIVNGNYSDSPIKISKFMFTIQTSTSIPLPVGFMDITVNNGAKLTLTSSDYLLLPGSTLKVESGGILDLGSKVDIVAMPYSSMPTGGRGYLKYYTSATDGSGKHDGKLIINGTLTGSGYNLGGKILTESAGATLKVVNTSGSYITMTETSSPYYQSGTVNSAGNIMTGANSYANRSLGSGTFYSKIVDGEAVWYSETADILFNADGNIVSTIQKAVGANGYTIQSSDFPSTPTRDFYTFEDWYLDENCTIKALGQTIFASTTLYAGWTPVSYNITYKFIYNGNEITDGITNDKNRTSYTYEDSFFLNPATYLDEYKFYRWYTDSSLGSPITQITGMHGDLILYGEFINKNDKTYNITYSYVNVNTDTEVSTPPATASIKSNAVATFIPANFDSYNANTNKNKYFDGWYTDKSCTAEYKFTSLSEYIEGLEVSENTDVNITLYGKWVNKLELYIGLGDLEYKSGKYYYLQGTTLTLPDISKYEELTSLINFKEKYPSDKYKFLGFTSDPSGCTAETVYKTDSNGYITEIETKITIGDLSEIIANNGKLKVSADMREILAVDITMNVTATYTHKWLTGRGTGHGSFIIDNIKIGLNSLYSINNSDWISSSETSINKKDDKTTNITIYIVKDLNTTITLQIANIGVTAKHIASRTYYFKAPESPTTKTNCTVNYNYSGSDENGISTFTINNITSNAIIKWDKALSQSD